MQDGVATSDSAALTGRHLFLRAFQIALGGWIGCVLLQCLLYLRPAPHGGPFLIEPSRYFGWALYYEMLGVWLISAPFLLLWLIVHRRAVSRPWMLLLWTQAGLLTANLLLSQADHEVMRFLGLRLTPSFLATYGRPTILGDRLFVDLMFADRGGAFLPLMLLVLAPLLYLGWSRWLIRRAAPRRTPPWWLAVILAAVPLAAPGNAWLQATGQFRLRKIEPAIIAIGIDVREGFADFDRPEDFASLAAEHQQAWLARSTDRRWRFPDPARPYLRQPTQPAGPVERWNVIYLQIETGRGADAGFLRPDRRPSPTPMLDRFAAAPRSASWTRANSFGMPSINGLFATHCSVAPHSRRYITGFTHARLLCLPELLRRRGWRAEIFHGDDTDWDNSSLWFNRWYDHMWRYSTRQRDRDVFRTAAERIRVLGRSGRPFWATVVSVTNHTPFRSPEPALNVAGDDTLGERILNTTRYTDDVVGEFLRAIAGEPWMSRTILVITGDHGFNTGEHGEVPGRHNLFRESVWVPLIIASAHPRLAPGRHDTPASLLDIAPTLAGLLGVREANPWQGHDLLAVNRAGRLAFGFGGSLLHESDRWSAIRHADGRYLLYADWLQQRDLARGREPLSRRLAEEAARAQRLHDHLLRSDRIWR